MRNTIAKWMAALAVMAASSAPAMACGGLYASGGCSPCGGQAYVSPCDQGYGYAGVAGYERLPEPAPVTRQYFYANQGPTYAGAGNFAPAPVYRETAIGLHYPRYDGGPYANPLDHYSYTPAYRAPVVYSYQPRYPRPSYRYGYGMRPRAHYGYAPRGYAPRYGYHRAHRFAGPRVMYAPRHAYHGGYPYQRPLRRAY